MSGRLTYLAARRRNTGCEIFDALDSTGRHVVVKHLGSRDDLGRRRFCREARLGRSLTHEGLAAIVDCGSDWIAFERLDPWSASPGRFETPAAAAAHVGDLARTLAHLHACGVVHRDVKPAHVMFRGDVAVIIDLGIAGLVGEDPLEGTEIVGSPGWMAPEQALGAAPAPSADIWSLCALAYTLVSGRVLYSGPADRVLEARRAGLVCRPDISDVRDRRLAAIIEAGLGPAADRPSAAEIAAALTCGTQGYWMTRSTAE